MEKDKIVFENYKSSDFKINSEHRDSQANIAESSLVTSAVAWAKPKDYAHEHKSEFATSIIFLILSASAAIFFGHYTLQTIIIDEADSPYMPIVKVLSIIVIGLIYWLEFTNISRITRTIKLNKVAARVIPVTGQRWATAVIISILNITLVTAGAYFQSKANDKTLVVINNSKTSDSLNIISSHNAEINRLQAQVNIINNNAKRLWRGQQVGYTTKDRELLASYEATINKLRNEKAIAISELNTTKGEVLAQAKDNLFNIILLKVGVAIIIELIILMSIIGIGTYWTGIYIEGEEKKSRDNKPRENKANESNPNDFNSKKKILEPNEWELLN
jgi:hypothetical protein